MDQGGAQSDCGQKFLTQGKNPTKGVGIMPETTETTPSVSPDGRYNKMHRRSDVNRKGADHPQEPTVDEHQGNREILLATGPELSQRLEAAKPAVYKGGGLLPQVPWKVRRTGMVLLVDLWSGFGGSILALLALGMQVIAVAAENTEVREVCHRNTPNVVHVADVGHIRGKDLLAVIRRRKFAVVLIGGGSPCQGNSELNSQRKGVKDPRTIGAYHVARIEKEFRQAAKVGGVEIPPIGTFIENVASAPKEVIEYYSQLVGAPPVHIGAGQFGYVQRNRLFWGQIDGAPLGNSTSRWCATEIEDVQMDWSYYLHDQWCPKAVYSGKALPKNVRLTGGYRLGIDPEHVVQEKGKGAICTFSREFTHPEDRMKTASKQAQKRFLQDGKRFPPGSYEAGSLAWKGDAWRSFTAYERAQMMCWPYEAMQEEWAREKGFSWAEAEARRNSFIGNGFHAPSIMLFFVLLLQLLPSESIPVPKIPSDEMYLRSRLKGTVWEPGFGIPGVLESGDLLQEVRMQFPSVTWESAGIDWSDIQHGLDSVDIRTLQAHWMSATMRGHNPLELAPAWQDQKDKAMHQAGIGSQRATSQSTRGLHPLLPPGLGKETHMAEAMAMPGIFDEDLRIEDDLWFAVQEMITFGVWHANRRSYVVQQWELLKKGLQRVDAYLIGLQHEEVHRVAADSAPALVAAATAIIRWPDRTQGERYVRGFPIVGMNEDTGVFRRLPDATDDQDESVDSLLGEYASKCLHRIIQSDPSEEFADEIWKQSVDEVQKGFAREMCTAEDLDEIYGPGQWMPMERFMVRQPSGKLRCIDNAKKFKLNKATNMLETLFIVGLDFIPAIVKVILIAAAAAGSDPVAHALEIGLIDLVDAYRYVPVLPEHSRFSISAVWSPLGRKWLFLRLLGNAFGLTAAVQNFNRRPALLCAVARRTLGMAVASYFDDFGLIDFAGANGTGLVQLSTIISMFGAPQSPSKRMPMAATRSYLGQVVHLGDAVEQGKVTLEAKPNARHEAADELYAMAGSDKIAQARASKIRGKVGWINSATYGRCGRFGTGVLKKFQYDPAKGGRMVSVDDAADLRMLAKMITIIPPRIVRVLAPPRPRVVVYSDASWEHEARLGWIVLRREVGYVPQGRSSLVTDEVLSHLAVRKTQIMACEAIAVPQAIIREPHLFAGSDVIWFIDNEAACSSLVRGTSSQEDIGLIAGITHFLMMRYDIRIWYEWIDSNSNPADGLSRDGLQDEWTAQQGWQLSASTSLSWQELLEVVPASQQAMQVMS